MFLNQNHTAFELIRSTGIIPKLVKNIKIPDLCEVIKSLGIAYNHEHLLNFIKECDQTEKIGEIAICLYNNENLSVDLICAAIKHNIMTTKSVLKLDFINNFNIDSLEEIVDTVNKWSRIKITPAGIVAIFKGKRLCAEHSFLELVFTDKNASDFIDEKNLSSIKKNFGVAQDYEFKMCDLFVLCDYFDKMELIKQGLSKKTLDDIFKAFSLGTNKTPYLRDKNTYTMTILLGEDLLSKTHISTSVICDLYKEQNFDFQTSEIKLKTPLNTEGLENKMTEEKITELKELFEKLKQHDFNTISTASDTNYYKFFDTLTNKDPIIMETHYKKLCDFLKSFGNAFLYTLSKKEGLFTFCNVLKGLEKGCSKNIENVIWNFVLFKLYEDKINAVIKTAYTNIEGWNKTDIKIFTKEKWPLILTAIHNRTLAVTLENLYPTLTKLQIDSRVGLILNNNIAIEYCKLQAKIFLLHSLLDLVVNPILNSETDVVGISKYFAFNERIKASSINIGNLISAFAAKNLDGGIETSSKLFTIFGESVLFEQLYSSAVNNTNHPFKSSNDLETVVKNVLMYLVIEHVIGKENLKKLDGEVIGKIREDIETARKITIVTEKKEYNELAVG